jgi:hypothetical protein
MGHLHAQVEALTLSKVFRVSVTGHPKAENLLPSLTTFK